MTDTITIHGRVFEVIKNDRESDPLDPGKVSYQLDGARGAHYFTIRNHNKPEMMFLAGAGRHGLSDPFPGTWLTDKNGKLEVA